MYRVMLTVNGATPIEVARRDTLHQACRSAAVFKSRNHAGTIWIDMLNDMGRVILEKFINYYNGSENS